MIAVIRKRPVTTAFVLIVVTSFIVLAVLGWAIQGNRALAADGKEAHDALCVFKADLARRAAESLDFIDHPPKTIIGIPVTPEVIAQAQAQLANQQSTLASLSELDCVGG